jgi:hypothetical protein
MTAADDYNAAELAAGRITPAHITTLTREFQTDHGLTVDGMCGPQTRAVIEEVAAAPPPSGDVLVEAGLRALARAKALWQQDIFDPKAADTSTDAARCRKVIDDMIRGPEGLAWTWEPAYAGDGYFEWCGAALAKFHARVLANLRLAFFASTYRLDRFARYQPIDGYANPKPATGPYRQIVNLDEKSTPSDLTFTPRTGDIVMIGRKAGYGEHICFVEGFDPAKRVFYTYEGNGTGQGPNGEVQQGVVRGQRSLGGPLGSWVARRLIRLAPADISV